MMQRRALLATACALPLAACGNIIGPGEAPQIYMLRPSFPAAPSGPKVSWALAVMLPDATDSLDTARIPVIKPDGSLDYYAGSQLPDRVTILVQDALVAGFEASGRIDQVSSQQDTLHADYNLVTEIRDFEVQAGDSTAVVSLSAKLVATRGRKIAASFTIRKTAPASADSAAAATQALADALTAAASAVITWALTANAP